MSLQQRQLKNGLEKVNKLDNEHYKKGAMQAVQVMQAIMSKEQFEGFLLGNEIKYRMRKDWKEQKEADERKARVYNYWRFLANQNIVIDPEKHIPPKSWTYKLIL